MFFADGTGVVLGKASNRLVTLLHGGGSQQTFLKETLSRKFKRNSTSPLRRAEAVSHEPSSTFRLIVPGLGSVFL